MKAAVNTIILVLLSLLAQATRHVAVYIVTEQDEWQTYMGARFWNDAINLVNDSDAIAVIYVTAGDRSCSGALDTNYYTARQQGADKSLEFAAEMAWIDGWSSTVVTVNGHSILTHTYRNIKSYYLQLPGGCSDGLASQSIVKLYNNTIPDIQSVDGNNTYTRANLVQTLDSIIITVADSAQHTTYNICEPDSTASTPLFVEHSTTGKLALEVLNLRPSYRINLYKEVGLQNMPPNVLPADVANNAALLSQMDREITNSGYQSGWTDEHLELLSRCYFHTIVK
jgi:hypothetical protein